MSNDITKIVEELAAIDPSFKGREAELRKLVVALIAKKPDTQLDEQFVARLRKELMRERPIPSPYARYFALPYAIVGVLAVLLVVPVGYYASEHAQTQTPVFAMRQHIEPLSSGAFGTLQAQEDGKGGGGPAASSRAGGAGDMKLLVPGTVNVYSYVYKGEPLALTNAEGPVYRRITQKQSSAQIASQLKDFNFGLVDLSGYDDLRVRTFELAQDKPYGYAINVNFDEGMISINPNYPMWPGLSGKEQPQQTAASALPEKNAVITIAKQFLDAHHISLANYGDAIVQDYPQATDLAANSQAAPEQLTVTFPLLINGKPTFEDGGFPHGLQVGVSVADKRVMSVYGLTSQTYTSSQYELVTDSNKIFSILADGGPHAWHPQETDGIQVKKVVVEVGKPEQVLMHSVQYKDGEAEELYVPALKFTVTKAPEGEQYYPKSIVIPLVSELLNQESGPINYNAVR